MSISFPGLLLYALSLVRNVNSIMDIKVWIMRGVVLQGPGLVMPMLSRANKQYLCASNVYDDRGRIVAALPFLPFLDSFFFHFPSQNTQWNDR